MGQRRPCPGPETRDALNTCCHYYVGGGVIIATGDLEGENISSVAGREGKGKKMRTRLQEVKGNQGDGGCLADFAEEVGSE